jgi:DNA-binding protein HU-beta
MTKKELIKSIAKKTNLFNADVERMLDNLGAVAAAELLGNGEVPLPGLGKLKAHNSKARKGRNPKTGETINIPAKTTVKFSTGKELKEALK